MTTLKAEATALLLIDVQERINGVIVDQNHLSRQGVLLEAFGALDLPVVTTEQYPKGLGPTLPELADRLPSPPVEKMTFSCARQPEAMAAIEATGRKQIVVTGIETHVCVLQTALDLLEKGYEVHVPHDAVNSRRALDKEWALHRMLAAGAVISATESALFELLERCGSDQFKAVSKLIRCIPV
ncbi:MAG: hydrolase [Acidobacteriota bacterium]